MTVPTLDSNNNPVPEEATYKQFLRPTFLAMISDDVKARRTKHNDGLQPIVIGHLSDSGDLKSHLMIYSYTHVHDKK